MDFEVILSGVQKIFNFLIVNLDKTDFDREFNIFWLFGDLLEEASDHSWDNTSLGLVLNVLSRHGVRFAGTSLTIGKNCSIVAIEDTINDRANCCVVNVRLG